MAKRVFDQVEICKENIFHKDDKKVNQEKIDDLHLAVLKSLDKAKISYLPREGAISSIRQRLNKQIQNLVPLLLTNVEETFVASELTEDQPHITNPNIVNNVVEYAGKGEQHSIIDILNFIVPKYIKKEFLIPNNITIKLCISEDEELHKPEGIQILPTKQLALEYGTFFSADWKFLVTCLGFNSANMNHFCPWCTYMKQQNGILDQNNKLVGDWTITKNMEQNKKKFF
ncbi:8873_t:CDS:2 [Gigaspora margarita]|uniref:8873_t:CDS:1 n=1 Tax=Gigaspora margarita TaxID=4874 RepID=A0ABN7VCH1_GIGMA|nr:8873_t:CDS:2 [Gigaspora margarita]